MNLPNTPAIARLSTILGVDIPARIRDMVNPFIISLPTPVDVEPTEGSYSMLFDTPHVRIATGTSAVQVVFPEPAYENKGRMFTVDVYQEEGGLASVEAVFPDESTQTLAAGIRHQFISANANAWMSVGGTGASAGFDFTFPDQVEVQMETPDPPENAGTYTMTSDERNILVTETAGGQSIAAVVLPAAELGSACRIAVSEGQKTCLVFGPTGQYAAVVNAGSSIDLLPYGDGKYCAVTDMEQLGATFAYLCGSTSDTPSATGTLWARVLHLQDAFRVGIVIALSGLPEEGDRVTIGDDDFSFGEGGMLIGETVSACAATLAAAMDTTLDSNVYTVTDDDTDEGIVYISCAVQGYVINASYSGDNLDIYVPGIDSSPIPIAAMFQQIMVGGF